MRSSITRKAGLLNGLGRHEDAILSYDTALAAKPDCVQARIHKGEALTILGRFLMPPRISKKSFSSTPIMPMRGPERACTF